MKSNNNIKKNEFIEEIERVKRSGGGEALLDREIIEILLSSVHSRTQAQAITKSLIDNCPGTGRILGRDIGGLKMIDGVTDSAAIAIICIREIYKRALREGLKKGPVMNEQETLIDYINPNYGLASKERRRNRGLF